MPSKLSGPGRSHASRPSCYLPFVDDDPDHGGVRLNTPFFDHGRQDSAPSTRHCSQAHRSSSGNSSDADATPNTSLDLSSPAPSLERAFSDLGLDSDTDGCEAPQSFQKEARRQCPAAASDQLFPASFQAFLKLAHPPRPSSAPQPSAFILPLRQPTTPHNLPTKQTQSPIGFSRGRPWSAPAVLRSTTAAADDSDPARRPGGQPSQRSATFRPMASLFDIEAPRTAKNSRAVHRAPASSFSANYRGERTPDNASVRDLPAADNCALWLTNLPADVSHRELLGAIRRVGRVWCCVINRPDGVSHLHAAAKVVFFDPCSAAALLARSRGCGVVVGGRSARVGRNRIKYAARPADESRCSRVLIVTGKRCFVNEHALAAYFSARFAYDLDRAVTLIAAGDRAVVEFAFASYRCQSQMAKMALERDRPAGFEKVEFGGDPCDVGDNLASYGVAGQRIQGIGI